MTRLHHVNVVCAPAQIEDMVVFYGRVLGLAPIAKPVDGTTAGGAWFDLGDGTQLHISERKEALKHPDQHFGLVVDDFTELLARLRDVGAPWTEQADLFGGRRGWTRDPAGNRIELLQGTGPLA
jgi:catechol 2,3-dioxygenase-like lactoylglutathione lyase family enzyme